MHIVADPEPSSSRPRAEGAVAPATTRVAIAGATGYTGQELLRLLARHPLATLTQTTSSGATAARKLPALSRLWDGAITPLDRDSLGEGADLVFLALPDTAAAELAPLLLERGRRVIDLSGAFRLHDAATRTRWYRSTTAQRSSSKTRGRRVRTGWPYA